MEWLFHDRFYRSKPEVMVADLMSLKQQVGETVANFMGRFIELRSRCNIKLPEADCDIIAI